MRADTSQRDHAPKPTSVEVKEISEKNVVGGMEFKGIGSVQIVASAGLGTYKALDMAEQVIEIMRDKLKEEEQNQLLNKPEGGEESK